MNKKIKEIYKKRQDAHDILLKCDIEIDKILINNYLALNNYDKRNKRDT